MSAAHALDAEVRLYEHLFTKENPMEVDEGQDFTANLNPDSLDVLTSCKVEPSLADASPGTTYQFERRGAFWEELVVIVCVVQVPVRQGIQEQVRIHLLRVFVGRNPCGFDNETRPDGVIARHAPRAAAISSVS